MKKNVICLALIFVIIMSALCACSTRSHNSMDEGEDFNKLIKTGEWENDYAVMYKVEEYGEYSLVTINSESEFLVVPEDCKVPSNIPENITVLKQPLETAYIVSSPVMDLIRQIDAMDRVRFTGTKQEDWFIASVSDAMADEDILYAGKYSTPDYELILDEGCDFVVENSMILHTPEVKEKLEELGLPVMVERSSYEQHPLGRLEWIKLYGLLFDKKEESFSYFEDQLNRLEPIIEKEKTGVSVVCFYITSNGLVNVRKPNDYVSKMIELAGGEYILADYFVEEENALSTMNMQMEDFYAVAKDADIIVYNSTIDGKLASVDELIEKNAIFKEFKAVREKNVYCTNSSFFQETTGCIDFIEDLNMVLTSYVNKDEAGINLHYLEKVK